MSDGKEMTDIVKRLRRFSDNSAFGIKPHLLEAADIIEGCSETIEGQSQDIGKLVAALASAGKLIDLIEGPFGWASCRNLMNLRLKDHDTYVRAYLDIRKALAWVGERPSECPMPDDVCEHCGHRCGSHDAVTVVQPYGGD